MLAERQGLHPRVLRPLRGMYRERRFVMVGHEEKEFVRLSSECASAKPPHKHLHQLSESQDQKNNAKSVCGRRWISH